MGFFSQFLLPEHAGVGQISNVDRPEPPAELLRHASELSKKITSPQEASDALKELTKHLKDYAPSVQLYIACGILLERTRRKSGMLESWSEIHDMFPEDALPFRMMLRWYRRMSKGDEGLERLRRSAATCLGDPKQAEKIILGCDELHTFDELETFMPQIFAKYPKNERLRFLYIKSLHGQGRIRTARRVLTDLHDESRLGPSAKALLQLVAEAPLEPTTGKLEDRASVIETLVLPFINRPVMPPTVAVAGPIVFFTGQLGAGGAERQLTRIAAAFQREYDEGDGCIGGHKMSSPPLVCVRDVDPAAGKDFFLPVLKAAGIDTYVLKQELVPDVTSLKLNSKQKALFQLLPDDMRTATLQLTRYFCDVKANVAYLWQDGGVLAAAYAALLADVPRIVTSFRGLPPNIRTEFLRPEYECLYRTLFLVPGVSFTANSQATATAYEDWLELPKYSISVLHNAVPDILPDGSTEDEVTWRRIESASPQCSKTVVGVFRFDHNKRPLLWINTAIAYSLANPDTRFLIVGRGDEFEECQALIRLNGAEKRVFLVGYSSHVGYWLHRSDLLMHLARFEGLPNVLIEAQLCGLPVLATPAGGTGDVVIGGKTGHLLEDSHNPRQEDILEQLSSILGNPVQMDAWGTAARKIAKPKFLLDRTLGATLDLFLAPDGH